MIGAVSRVFLHKGFAFIMGEDHRSRFAHVRAFKYREDFDLLHEGQMVEFDHEDDQEQKGPRAVNIVVVK